MSVSIDELNEKLDALDRATRSNEKGVETSTKTDGEVRSELALKFVYLYFVLLGLVIIGVPIYNYLMYSVADKPELIISIKDALLTFSAILGSTFGLVIAYYFQNKDSSNP